MSEGIQVEAAGESVGEAKWMALRELERLIPGLDKSAVRFQVVSEGERGLLGVGYEPARVIASADREAAAPPAPRDLGDDSPPSALVRELVERVTAAMGIRCRVDVTEDEESITASCSGAELGLLIGKHGQTIDALQYLANAIAFRGEAEHKRVIVDAEGYRERRRATLESLAERSAERALETGEPVELEPMTAAERRVVHEFLKDHGGVSTRSEGAEPNRYVVVLPGE